MKVPYNIQYTREKLRNAVYALATEPGDVRSRLAEAFSRCWILSEGNFPKELRDDWSWVVEQMNKYGPRKDDNGKIITGAIDNTMIIGLTRLPEYMR